MKINNNNQGLKKGGKREDRKDSSGRHGHTTTTHWARLTLPLALLREGRVSVCIWDTHTHTHTSFFILFFILSCVCTFFFLVAPPNPARARAHHVQLPKGWRGDGWPSLLVLDFCLREFYFIFSCGSDWITKPHSPVPSFSLLFLTFLCVCVVFFFFFLWLPHLVRLCPPLLIRSFVIPRHVLLLFNV